MFFFNDPATTEIYTLSLHDALPIWQWLTDQASRLFDQFQFTSVNPAGGFFDLDEHGQAIQGSLRQIHSTGRMKIGRAHVLNSSHANISYAVFCLKKKNTVLSPVQLS